MAEELDLDELALSPSVLEEPVNSKLKVTLAVSTDAPTFDDQFRQHANYMQSMATVVAEPKLNIETLHAKDFSRVTWSFVLAVSYTIIYNIVYIILANTAWRRDVDFGGGSFVIVDTPTWFLFAEFFIQLILSALLLFTTLIFLIAVIRTNRSDRLREMFFVMVLSTAVALIYLPFLEVLFEDVFLYLEDDRQELNVVLLLVSALINGVLSIIGIYFFVWSTTISYRTSPYEPLPRSYYFKMAFLVLFLAIRLMALFLVGFQFNWVPFTSLAAAVGKLHKENVGLGASQIFMLSMNACFEALLILLITLDMKKTHDYVNSLDYLNCRAIQIGFRQFEYYCATTFIVSIVASVLTTLVVPDDNILMIAKYTGIMYFEPSSGRMTYIAIIPAFAMQQLYYMLPAGAPSLGDVLRCKWKRHTHDSPESIVRYRVFERQGDCTFKPASFVMQTCVSMFNLAWLPYSYGVPSKPQQTPQDYGDTKFRIVHYASDQATDTHALVISAEDRIVVSFKGTTSGQNILTDVNTRLVNVEILNDQYTQRSLDGTSSVLQSMLKWRNYPMVHAGFLTAYRKVQEAILNVVEEELDFSPRPVFFTGHSLGGALATLCSFDVHKRLNPREGIFTFTFGSPRVGNHTFCRLYDEELPCHWRVVLAKDPITKLPPGLFFHHVGQSALVTEEGHLFIDPTLFELTWMHASAGLFKLKAHRKSGYATAIMKFIEKRHQLTMGQRGVIWKKAPRPKTTGGGTSTTTASVMRAGNGTMRTDFTTI